jgi:hypothetical protein
MRKYFALMMVALLAMMLALAAVGCGAKQEEASTPPAETPSSAMPDTGAGMMADTTMGK